jgi:hypothetical protein
MAQSTVGARARCPHSSFQIRLGTPYIVLEHLLTPKDPWVFGCKTTQNYPLLKKGPIIIF